MSATDELRRMLDERGVKWGNIRRDGSESDYLTEWQFEDNQGKAIAIEWAVGSGLSVEVHRYRLTPEQAIAATLGSCNCSNNCTNSERTGTLTAERVMAIAGRHQPDYCSDTHVCFDWQAIADELNATMGSADLAAENAKLRELVRTMFYTVHPLDREQFLANVTELGVEVNDA